MRVVYSICLALCVGGTAAILAGCAAASNSIGVPGVSLSPDSIKANTSSGYQTIFSFYGTDGGGPDAVLVSFKGQLYGTTVTGGTSSDSGTVFSITPSGKERVLHSFGQNGDGVSPQAGLVRLNRTFYGTTYSGGKYNDGTVFSVTPHGDEKVLYSFNSNPDGKWPQAGLVAVGGTLYGTTSKGGNYDAGTIFSVTTSGKESVLHSFTYSSIKDGAKPVAGLIAIKQTLYGTTLEGGSCYSQGTVFSLALSGKEQILHNFGCGNNDGVQPDAGLVAIKNVLYGTTSAGGPYQCHSGTVFSLTLKGKEKVLHNFCSAGDGVWPITALIVVNGILYGATYEGGASGNGTVYSITPTGTEKVLHNFGSSPDGQQPMAGLTNVNGTLYGTTANGGGSGNAGTVYSLMP